MNKNMYLLYKISKEIKEQYSLYDKYGLTTNLQSTTNETSKTKGFVLSEEINTTNSTICSEKEENPSTKQNLTSLLKQASFISSEKETFLSMFQLNNTGTKKEENSSISQYKLGSSEDSSLSLVERNNYSWSSSLGMFDLNSLPESVNSKSFKVPRDFSTDFRNIEDWSSIQNRPYDSLTRNNFSEVENDLNYNFGGPGSKKKSVENKITAFNAFSSFQEFYNTKYSGENVSKLNSKSIMPVLGVAKNSLKTEFNNLVSQEKFVNHYKNTVLIEQVLSEDIKGIYKNRLETEKKLRWFYGLLSKSSFNRLIHPFKTNRSLRSKKGISSSVIAKMESRLDVQLFRMRWAPTIIAARQLVQHNHIVVWSYKNYCSSLLEGRKIPEKQISNYELQSGDIIMLKPSAISVLENYWNILDQSITENKTNQIGKTFSYNFPWFVFQKSSILSSLNKRWNETSQSSSLEKKAVYSLYSDIGSLQVSEDLGEKLVDLVDFNLKEKSSSSSFEFIGSPTYQNKASLHIEYNPEGLFHIYRKSTDLSKLKFPQLDSSQLKTFLFSHN